MTTLQNLLPEWPRIDPTRPSLIGVHSGADHPFGAVVVVITPLGLVCVREYLQRQRALAEHLDRLRATVLQGLTPRWATGKDQKELQLEFAHHGIGTYPVESDDLAGIQRVQSWLHAKQLWFAPTVPQLVDQLKTYRFRNNVLPSGEKRATEQVFERHDELTRALRFALLAWPRLPTLPEKSTGRDLSNFDAKTQADIARMTSYETDERGKDMAIHEAGYPFGDGLLLK